MASTGTAAGTCRSARDRKHPDRARRSCNALEDAGIPPAAVPAALARADWLRAELESEGGQASALGAATDRVDLSPDRLRLVISLSALALPVGSIDPRAAVLVREIPLQIKRRGVEVRVVIENAASAPAEPDPVLWREIRRAHRWFEALVSGQVGSI